MTTREQLEANRSQLIEDRRALQTLMEAPGWELFCKYLNEASHPLRAAILARSTSMDEMLEKEFQKGHMRALEVLPNYPMAFVEDINTSLSMIETELETLHMEEEQTHADSVAGQLAEEDLESERWGSDGDGDISGADSGRDGSYAP